MNRDKALLLVKKQITEKRYQHTLGVEKTALELAAQYGANPTKASLAAIFHDYAKFRPIEEMEKVILTEKMDQRLLQFHHELWHAPVGAYLVEKEAGIDDQEILDAIRYHTTGRRNMSLLEKVIYLADYIEPGRYFPGVDEVREIAKRNLNQALLKAAKNTIIFLVSRDQMVFPDSLEMYHDLLKNKGAQ
ncbi:bis(5'-nucleosyl)-tetraphosphatase (symmetrical) YqeK [Bacillus chungangensis]|uniref:bis(5'-nucleosyl)-tetraphosphatase (symmetrical) n=1 Tax=Bacillus chungangensis TaxID=587633 RepID=A0ABT9WML1_9BACI|nr:bis(5'-nucleosyl)-tetraphosphatase (symmetrical) YqeK [Bacillus chungangensis]MDQ0174212.1 putative HD superfamily hydrolase involved in NAD metabolism [Bacillus chungangensis]